MKITTARIQIETKGHTHIADITEKVQATLLAAGLVEGIVHLFAVGSTLGLTTIEYEPGLVSNDMAELFEAIAPYARDYAHNRTWGDDNGASHLRAALIGPSLSVPFQDRTLCLGPWQQIVVIDFDTRPRSREIVVQLHGIAG